MARKRIHGLNFKRQVAQERLSGRRSCAALAHEHGVSRTLVNLWAKKYEAGELDVDAAQAYLLSRYESRIAELERMVGQLVIENQRLREKGRAQGRRAGGHPRP